MRRYVYLLIHYGIYSLLRRLRAQKRREAEVFLMKEMEAQIEAEEAQRTTPTRISRKTTQPYVRDELPPSSPPESSPEPDSIPPQYYQKIFKSVYSFNRAAGGDGSASDSDE